MDARKEAKLGLYNNITTLCANNAATVAAIPAFANSATQLNGIIVAIRSANQVQENMGTGSTNKKMAKQNLVDLTCIVAGGVFAYASSIGNGNLKAQTKITPTALAQSKDEVLPQRCTDILAIATANQAAIIPFGITPAILTALQSAISDYNATITDPAIIKSKKKVATQNLTALFKQAETLLKEQMDKTVLLLKSTDAGFVEQYKSLRDFVDPGTSATQLKVTVLSATNETPLNAKVFATDTIVLTTDANGVAAFKPITPGTYNVRAAAEGYAEQTKNNVQIKLGKRSQILLKLVPSKQ